MGINIKNLPDDFISEAEKFFELTFDRPLIAEGQVTWVAPKSGRTYETQNGGWADIYSQLWDVLMPYMWSEDLVARILTTDGEQTITSVKTFVLSQVFKAYPQLFAYTVPNNDLQFVVKKYVDDLINAISSNQLIEEGVDAPNMTEGQCGYKNSAGEWVGSSSEAIGYFDGTNITMAGFVNKDNLDPGEKYYIQSDTSVGRPETPYEAGVAISDTVLCVAFRPNPRVVRKEITTNYTIALSDNLYTIEANSEVDVTITIPDDTTVNFEKGTVIGFSQEGIGRIVFSPANGVTIRSPLAATRTGTQYAMAFLEKIDSNTWQLSGYVVV